MTTSTGWMKPWMNACGRRLPARPDRKARIDAQLAQGARRLRATTDRAIIGLFGGNLLETGQMLYRNDVFFMLLAG